MSASLLVAFSFFNFHGEAQMHAVRVCIVVISQQNLKVEVLHVSVRGVRELFFCIDVFEHALKNEVEGSWYISRNVSIIGSCFNELSNFSYLIASVCIV